MRRKGAPEPEEIFCVLAARGFAPEEAARRAGLAGGEDGCVAAATLLGQVRVRRKIVRLCRELRFCAPAVLARAGLERLALGDASGAVALLDGEGDGGSNLFHVAEVRRPKGGGVEIKFFDRVRALGLLAALDDPDDQSGGSLLDALGAVAREAGDDGTE